MPTPVVQSVVPECRSAVVDLATDSTLVFNGPCLLVGVYVNTVLSAHACPIQDDATAVVTLIASLAAGSQVDCRGVKLSTSLVVNPDDIATGNITVFYIPL